LRKLWPEATLYGVDIADAARRDSWRDKLTVLNPRIPSFDFETDVVFTCTALQHVTDRETFTDTVKKIQKALLFGSYLAFFENVTRPAARHVLGFSAADYMRCFPGIQWREPRFLNLRGEPHAWMVGMKQ
jgi:hypothetical protein